MSAVHPSWDLLQKPLARGRQRCSVVVNLLGVCSVLGVFLGLAASPSFGQEVPKNALDANMDALRTRAPAGENDTRTLDEWIAHELTALEGAEEINQLSAAATFRGRFLAQIQNKENTPEFTGRFAERAAAAFQPRLSDCKSLAPPVALALAWVLSEFEHVGTAETLITGLRCEDRASVRYLCAKGLARLGPKFVVAGALNDTVLKALNEAGQRETDGVVVTAIYEALQANSRSEDATTAMIDVLTARVNRRAGLQQPVSDGGELPLLEFLLAKPPEARGQNEQLVPQIARTLRLDVGRLGQKDLSDKETIKLATSIHLCEALLVKVVKPQPDKEPNVRRALGKLKDERLLDMQIELNKWIGTEQTPGVLNGAPWNVPTGAP